MTIEGDEIKLGEKMTQYDETFRYLSHNFNSKHNRDMFNEIDTNEVRMMCLKDPERLAAKIKEVFNGKHITENTGTCSCTTLVKNKVSNQYSFFFGDRKNTILYGIESNIFDDLLHKSDYTSNNRIVHSHFNNVWFDGIKTVIIKHEGTEYKREIPNKTDFAKEFKVDDVMNFPVDLRHPVVAVEEAENISSDMDSSWTLKIKFPDGTSKD